MQQNRANQWSVFIEWLIPCLPLYIPGSYLKIWILVQNQGGDSYQPSGILKYVEDLKRDPNTEIGPKDFFVIASNIRFGFKFDPIKDEICIGMTNSVSAKCGPLPHRKER